MRWLSRLGGVEQEFELSTSSVPFFDVSSTVATAAPHHDLGPVGYVDPNRAIPSIGECVSWVVADNIDVTEFVGDLACQPRKIVYTVSVINWPAACRGHVRHKIAGVLTAPLR